MLYFVQDGGIVTTVRPETGEVLKRGRLKDAGGQYYASPVAADGKVFVVSTDGKLSVLKAGEQWESLATSDLGKSC